MILEEPPISVKCQAYPEEKKIGNIYLVFEKSAKSTFKIEKKLFKKQRKISVTIGNEKY